MKSQLLLLLLHFLWGFALSSIVKHFYLKFYRAKLVNRCDLTCNHVNDVHVYYKIGIAGGVRNTRGQQDVYEKVRERETDRQTDTERERQGGGSDWSCSFHIVQQKMRWKKSQVKWGIKLIIEHFYFCISNLRIKLCLWLLSLSW